MIWYKGDMLKQTRSTEWDNKGETYLWHNHPNCTQMWDVNFFYMNTMIHLLYCWFSYNNVASSEMIWATTREDGSKLLYRTGGVLYVCVVRQVRTWFFSVRDCWHDYERQDQSYTFTLHKWLKMSMITYVASKKRSRTRLFCYIKCYMRFWPSWT